MLELTKDNFEEEVLKSTGFVLVDFWGDGCEPCKALMPDVEALAAEYEGKVAFKKLNTSKARRVAISQKVLGLPTILLYKDGVKIAEVTGKETSKDTIKAMLDSNI
ncbi:MAG: thioredoxin domain-containing protein [Bacillota bacterium]|nr:thioredoxin domain-containing protein [Bacillota bacterium]